MRMYDKALMYSKTNCASCLNAEVLLHTFEIPTTKIVVGADITREELLEEIPNAKSVPQIFLFAGQDKIYIGGYEKLKEYLHVK